LRLAWFFSAGILWGEDMIVLPQLHQVDFLPKKRADMSENLIFFAFVTGVYRE
jgi:hypothetical protein